MDQLGDNVRRLREAAGMIHEYPEIETVTANHLVEAWMPLPEMYEGH